MDREIELGVVRRACAKEIMATSAIPDARASRRPLPKCARRISSIPGRGWSSESGATKILTYVRLASGAMGSFRQACQASPLWGCTGLRDGWTEPIDFKTEATKSVLALLYASRSV